MNERLQMISFTLIDPTDTNAIGTLEYRTQSQVTPHLV